MATSRKRTVEIDVVVDDKQASQKLKDVGDGAQKSAKGFSGLSTGMKTAAIAGGAFVATNVVQFLGDATTAAMDDEKAQADLARQLEASTGATDTQVEAIEEYIDQTARATGVADDELRPALETLARATGDATKAQELLTTAMDISAATGKPLQTVVDAISKAAQNGSTGGLARLGLKIKDINGDMLTLDEIMANAATTMGGATAVAAETAAGKMARLSVAVDEAKEEIGAALLPALEAAIPLILDALKPLSLAIVEVNQWTGAISDMDAAIRTWEIHMGTSADTAAAALQIWSTGNVQWKDLLKELKLGPAELVKLAGASDSLLTSLGVTSDKMGEFRENTKTAMLASMDSRGEQTKQRGSLSETEGQLDETAEAQAGLTQEVQTYIDKLKAQTDPVFAAIDAAQNLADKQADLAAKQADSTTSADDLAQAQLDVAEAIIDAQGAMDDLSPAQLNNAIESIATVLGISTGEVQELLNELDVLDGKTVKAYIDIQERFRAAIERSRPGGVEEHAHSGGTVPGVPGSEVPMVLRAGEFVSQGGRDPHGNGNGGPLIVQVNVDGKRFIEELVVPQLARYSRRNGGLGI